MSKSNPDVEITINGDEIKIRLITMLISLEDIFTVGTPFEQKQPDGNVSLVRNLIPVKIILDISWSALKPSKLAFTKRHCVFYLRSKYGAPAQS